VPKLLYARTPEDAEEERKIYKLSRSRHALGDWIFRARIISLSWRGLRTTEIAEELGCHPKTVRKRLHRFNALGIDGLGDRPGSGRKPRLTEQERSARRRCALAPEATVGRECGSAVRPKRSRIIELYTDPPLGSTVVCVDEKGPVTPRFFPPAPGWSPDGHRIKAPLEYGLKARTRLGCSAPYAWRTATRLRSPRAQGTPRAT
jgi:Winged helix-turn helix